MWGLYENLPPPSSSSSSTSDVSNQKNNVHESNSSHSQKDEWSAEAKLLAPALRRKTAAAAAANTNTRKIPKNLQKREQSQAIISETYTLEQYPIQSVPSLWSGVQDTYDPLVPNDYEKVLEERKKQKTNHQEQHPSKVSAFAPPQIYHHEDETTVAEQLSFGPVSPMPAQATNTNVAAKIMAKMGYKEGHGLGRDEQGITAPLVAKKADNRTAILVLPQENTQKTTSYSTTKNVVGPGEVDEYLKPEIQEECAKFGAVDSCKIYEDTKKGIPPEQAVRIFVCFAHHEGAQKAYEGLHGRYFGGRIVQAFYFDEGRFRDNNLQAEEIK